MVLGDGFLFESRLDSVSEIYLFMVAERGLLTSVEQTLVIVAESCDLVDGHFGKRNLERRSFGRSR